MTRNDMEAICARCGEHKPLCDSLTIDGIKQPRICKDCLICSMETGDEEINELYWFLQLIELNETESIERINNIKENE